MRIFFDINRLVWGASRASPSGIDRVVVAYGRWLDERYPDQLWPVVSFRGRLYRIRRGRFRQILQRAESIAAAPPSHDENWRLLTAALEGAKPSGAIRLTRGTQNWRDWPAVASALSLSGSGLAVRTTAQDRYINVAHTGLHDARLLGRLAQRRTASAVMIHDLIPLTHPEFCAPPARARHAARMEMVFEHASLVIANSRATADEVLSLARTQGRPTPRVVVARLGISEAFLQGAAPLRSDTPYFVCVGTIEARKNLALLMSVWRRLAEQMGPSAPHLVLVGLRGWENEAVIDHLERSDAACRLVHEVGVLSDEDLASLLLGSRALLAPSFAEGYDLPVIESLCLGVPVIASDIPAHRELASQAQLVDTLDGPGWLRAISKAVTTQPETGSFQPPLWADHFQAIETWLTTGGDEDASGRA